MVNVKLTTTATGPIRELHGMNCAPYERKEASESNYTLVDKLFHYMGTPRSRLHDVCGPWGGFYYVDIPNIFRDFEADPYDPDNYDFHYTDEYIESIIRTGAQIVYRLGVTIEWGSKKYASFPPADNHKWAVICEHIIRHYNEGWNNGFHYDITYWEIWNEPENPPMWQGTKEQFFELYKVASLHLKQAFPHLKIGGYGSCGVYASFRPNMNDFFKSFLTYFTEFLAMVKENGCPLDFYSWHIYTRYVHEVIASARYVRKTLDENGFTATESHLNEWNYGPEGGGFMKIESQTAASFCASSMISMQENGVYMSQYYDASINRRYNGLINLRTLEFSPVVHAFAAFSRLYKAGNALLLETSSDAGYDPSTDIVSMESYADIPEAAKKLGIPENILSPIAMESALYKVNMPYMLAAGKDGNACCLISNYARPDFDVKIDLTEYAGKTLYLYESKDETGFKELRKELVKADTDLTISVVGETLYYLAVCDEETKEVYCF